MNKQLIPAAGYLRMSSDKQDTSIEGQRAELLAYAAKRGYQIVAWYADEGISGWKNKQRQGFHRLIADAAEGAFKAVLCWDQSRFSRFDPMEANYFWHQLRQAGVTLETIKEGKLDFDSLGGWLSASVQQHAKAEYCRSLAHDVVRARKKLTFEGKWLTSAPYGYRIDKQTQTLVFGDADKVETVRRVFRMRASGLGVRTIAMALNREQVTPPRGQPWTNTTIRRMLCRETYIGNTVIGERPRGRFAHVTDERQVIEKTHPAIIDPALWAAVQRMNAERRLLIKKGNRPSVVMPLSGLLRCGRCGCTMVNDKFHHRYQCGSYRTSKGCSHNCVSHEVALRLVAAKIKSIVLKGSLNRLTTAIEQALERRRRVKQTIDTGAIKKQIADLNRKLETAADRLLDVEPSLVATVQASMAKLLAQRDGLKAQLSDSDSSPCPAPLTAQQIAAQAWALEETLQRGDAATVQNALAKIIDHVEVRYKQQAMPHSTSGRVRWVICGGTIHFKKYTLGASGWADDHKLNLLKLPDSVEITKSDWAAAV